MTGQRWPDCDPAVGAFVERTIDALRATLGTNLVGLYLHGSLAMGSYHPPKSDVDLLVVVRDPVSVADRERVSRALLQVSDERPTVGDIELSVVTCDASRHFVHPMPFEVHVGSGWWERVRSGDVPYAEDRRDSDLAAHVTSVRERGVVLVGPPAAEVFAEVRDEDFRDSIEDDLEWIVTDENVLESPYYGVLNGCRMLMVRAHPAVKVPSKDEGGAWALDNVPDEHRAIVRQALDVYQSSAPVSEELRKTGGVGWDRDALLAFRDYLRAEF